MGKTNQLDHNISIKVSFFTMDGFEINKFAAAILIAGIIAMLAGNLADIMYEPNKKFDRGYQVEIEENQGSISTSKEEEKIDIKDLMSKADAEKGKHDIKKCSLCHTFDNGGANKIGPNLWNIVGSPKASSKTFSYSKSMLAKGGEWNAEDLFAFLSKPNKFIPGTKMAFAGYKNHQNAANIIAYLKTLSNTKSNI